MKNFIDELMYQLYSSSLSLMDIIAIFAISGLANEFHWSVWFLLIPWIFYSAYQKIKYDK